MAKKSEPKSILPDIKWHVKCKTTIKGGNSDISINVSNGGKQMTKGTKKLSIIIRDNLWKQFKSDYIVFAIMKNRIYFRASDRFEGYKIAVKNTSAYIGCVITGDEIADYESFVGNYHLRFDDYYELYYIDIEQEGLIK